MNYVSHIGGSYNYMTQPEAIIVLYVHNHEEFGKWKLGIIDQIDCAET